MTLTFSIVDGDVPHGNATGRPLTLEGSDKFKQDIKEILDVGADLGAVVGLIGDTFSIRAEIARRVDTAFAFYKTQQDTIQRSDRLPEERFSRTTQIIVLPLRSPGSGTVDQTSYAWRIDVLSAKGASPTTTTGTLVR